MELTLKAGDKLYISVGHEGNQDGNNTFGGGGKGNPGKTRNNDGHFYGNGFSGGGKTVVATVLEFPTVAGDNTGLLFVAGGGGGGAGATWPSGENVPNYGFYNDNKGW